MPVIVTKHAIKRYRERLFNYSLNDNDVADKLKEIADKGAKVGNRLYCQNTCFEIKYQGVSIVVIYESECKIVLTCLGEGAYRRWIKTKGMKDKLSQRLLLNNADTV